MLKVLIVEDNPEKEKNIVAFFNNIGLYGPSIEICGDVTSALKNLRIKQYHIVCLDLNLPMRINEPPKENGGITILNKLTSPQYIKPKHIFGLTDFSNILHDQIDTFHDLDFNLYSYSDNSWEKIIRKKINWIKDTENDSSLERIPSKVINIFVHGIMTTGNWQDYLEQKISTDTTIVISYKYNYYSALKILSRFTRKKQVDLFTSFLENILIKNPESTVNIIGHSFGTYLIVNALENIKLDNLTRLNYLILSGSVVRADHDFNPICDKYAIKNIVNDCGINDIPLIMSKLFCFGLGHGGRVGFNSSSNKVINRYHKSGHSMYSTIPDFIDTYWINILVDNKILPGKENIDTGINKIINPIVGILNPIIIYSLLLLLILI
ncbi:hypothetical protein CJF25_16365 [Photobacterium phosphoreum]|uniref:response regulator n=1 Tax=Photobacterium TaxID=657 RepID=UPI000D15AC80|nr:MULTISPECIES: hypothetical protein [Photobacterium]MCD9464537.1 hypothetical protein [Photobacterium phosphoreum]PST93136.1 hypothetical protein C9I87_14080 [Photobacterium iliopiscarium]